MNKVEILLVAIAVSMASIGIFWLLTSEESPQIHEYLIEDTTIKDPNVSIVLNFDKDNYPLSDHVSFSANITNHANESISPIGYTMTLYVRGPNNYEEVLFFRGNASLGTLLPGKSHQFGTALGSYGHYENGTYIFWDEEKESGTYYIWGVYNNPLLWPFPFRTPPQWPYNTSFSNEIIITIS